MRRRPSLAGNRAVTFQSAFSNDQNLRPPRRWRRRAEKNGTERGTLPSDFGTCDTFAFFRYIYVEESGRNLQTNFARMRCRSNKLSVSREKIGHRVDFRGVGSKVRETRGGSTTWSAVNLWTYFSRHAVAINPPLSLESLLLLIRWYICDAPHDSIITRARLPEDKDIPRNKSPAIRP
ncbi:hypothetical protein PUN28_010581 [Cardiocondyla obscurior]|uniref:Uncharacterized protein n=1 Tax=Cardiocondyla obscurior TaxID=286306 RepID=A0AAW2FHZ8_9HYME